MGEKREENQEKKLHLKLTDQPWILLEYSAIFYCNERINMTNMINEENVCISKSTEQIKETLDLHISCFFSVTRFFHLSLALTYKVLES